MTIILFDDQTRESLLPLTYTRPVAAIRVGILTIGEKWQRCLKADQVGYQTEEYLRKKFTFRGSAELYINGSVCPDEDLLEAIDRLKAGQVLVKDAVPIAAKAEGGQAFDITEHSAYSQVAYSGAISRIIYPENIFSLNDSEIKKDFKLLTAGRTSAPLSSTNTVLGDDVFLEEGAEAECSTFNTKNGPVYIGRNSQVWEGCHIRGAFALCDHSQIKMGAKIYGATTIGPYCRVGGEINNAVLLAYSSKGHEGFLGNSVVGEWCNIGADSNNSNLKNNYGEVKLWDYSTKCLRPTGLQFCGLIMADHAKCAINTMFNTGTVVGVSANIFGAGFPGHYIPDFGWGGSGGYEVYSLDKMIGTAEKVYARRNQVLDDVERDILVKVFELTKKNRRF